MNAQTPWGPVKEQMERHTGEQKPTMANTPVIFHMPWHKGWLGGIEVDYAPGGAMMKLSRSQAREYMASCRSLGREVIVQEAT